MSEEIVFADMLNHYSLKISEISDMLCNMVTYLSKSIEISRESWNSDAANKFLLEISETQQYINAANLSIDDLMKLFSTMKINELDSLIDSMDKEIDASINN